MNDSYLVSPSSSQQSVARNYSYSSVWKDTPYWCKHLWPVGAVHVQQIWLSSPTCRPGVISEPLDCNQLSRSFPNVSTTLKANITLPGFLKFLVYCGKNTYHEIYPLNRFLNIWYSIIYRHYVLQQISKTYAFLRNWNFGPVISNFPFSPSPAPGNHHSSLLLRVWLFYVSPISVTM